MSTDYKYRKTSKHFNNVPSGLDVKGCLFGVGIVILIIIISYFLGK